MTAVQFSPDIVKGAGLRPPYETHFHRESHNDPRVEHGRPSRDKQQPKPNGPRILDFALGALLDARLRVLTPIAIKLEQDSEAGCWVAIAESLHEFGAGDTPHEALVDLQRTIGDLFMKLRGRSNFLGSNLAQTWTILSRHVSIQENA